MSALDATTVVWSDAPLDELETDEGTVVMFGAGGLGDGQGEQFGASRVVLLSALGVEIVHLATQGVTIGELAQRLIETFGAPDGDPEGAGVGALVVEIVDALVTRGIVRAEG